MSSMDSSALLAPQSPDLKACQEGRSQTKVHEEPLLPSGLVLLLDRRSCLTVTNGQYRSRAAPRLTYRVGGQLSVALLSELSEIQATGDVMTVPSVRLGRGSAIAVVISLVLGLVLTGCGGTVTPTASFKGSILPFDFSISTDGK